MKNFKNLLIGDNALLTQCAEILLREGGTIVAIATEAETVRDWAIEHQIPLVNVKADIAAQLVSFEYDWLFSIANLRMIPESVCARARRGAINFHDGPLPDLAGLNTPSWSLLEGRTVHGVAWHAITPGVDEGDIHVTDAIEVSPDETVLSLNTKCLEAGIRSFGRLVAHIANDTLPRQAQDFSRRGYHARIARPAAAGTLRFTQTAEALSRLVRATSFGAGYANPLVTPKLRLEGGLFTVSSLTIMSERAGGAPGEVLAVDDQGIIVGTATSPVLLALADTLAPGAVPAAQMVQVGERLPLLDDNQSAILSAALARVAPHEHVFRKWIARAEDIGLEGVAPATRTAPTSYQSLELRLPGNMSARERGALVLAYLARIANRPAFDVALSSGILRAFSDNHPGYFARCVPLRVEAAEEMSVAEFIENASAAIAEASRRITYPLDLFERTPRLAPPDLSVGLVLGQEGENDGAIEGCALSFVLGDEGSRLVFDPARVTMERVGDIAARLAICVSAFTREMPLNETPIMTDAERQHVLYDLNKTDRLYDTEICVHDLVKRQAETTPDAVAVSFGRNAITYRELEGRATRIAAELAARGAGPDVVIGLHLPRSIEMVVGAYAILKAGAAYLPLDPAFPANRLSLMVEDSGTDLILSDRRYANTFADGPAAVVAIEDLSARAENADTALPQARSENLAYVIYTSGSTGRPKGVMVEHRNVVNFFAGMDERIPRSADRQDSWLAVTSISFDISVLEIFWTLARGFKVVIHSSALDQAKATGPKAPQFSKELDFSLYYWGNDDGVGAQKYRTLLEGARFADAHGFQAVWTPERHFHAFGGPYPNPAVTGAAVAAVTKNLAIRAGSCVLPLHHPLRVAEEWAVVDNLSNGRVGLAFASGWMPEDFVLRPENAPPENKAAMLRDIETVRRLWRGDAVEYSLGERQVSVVTQPRPMSLELPVWITTAGNPDSYREAARLGANVLTHLLGQSVEELAGKIAIYRKTLEECGRNPADHKVSVMLHTLIGADRERVRDLAREPMKTYLRSATALIKQYAWAFPAFKKPAGVSNPIEVDLQSLAADEMDAILEFAFVRYFEDSGLFGTVEDGLARVAQLDAIGVDEIACLIDFGLPSQTVLDALVPLADVVQLSRAVTPAEEEPAASLAADIHRDGVTHLQCTPSMAGMFLGDPDDRAALAKVKHLFIGGEALKKPLVAALNQATAATIENMYGPTETTIWSSTVSATLDGDVVPLGQPIANTQLYVLDHMRQPVPPSVPGELYIGGDGVTRGYLNREELTRKRFLPNPFAGGRMYRTGDLVRLGSDNRLDFIGRADNQVKIRGNRIELGEIEVRIAELQGVRDAVVVVREDRPGDMRIVAYLRTSRGIADNELRDHLAADLPEYMLPAHYVRLDAFPLTPNAKVDRNRLPKPVETPAIAGVPTTMPEAAAASGAEKAVAEVFKRTLGLAHVGLHDNFFTLGGHSLLAVQMHRELKGSLAPSLTITDLFRFPTVAGLALHIAGRSDPAGQLSKVAERAAARRASFENRRATFARASDPA